MSGKGNNRKPAKSGRPATGIRRVGREDGRGKDRHKVNGLTHRVVSPGDVPIREILDRWEAVDWEGVNRALRDGQAVCIDDVDHGQTEY